MVIGPASATVMSLKMFGRDMHPTSLNLWGPPESRVDINVFCPRDMQTFMYQDIQMSLWENMSCANTIFDGIRGLPWLKPIRMMLNKKLTPKWPKKHRNMLRSLAALGIWTKERFKNAGYIVDSNCLCGEPESLKRVLWHCPQSAQFRATWGLDENIPSLLQQHPTWSGWVTGIPKDPSWVYPQSTRRHHHKLRIRTSRKLLQHPCFWRWVGDFS